MKTLRAIFWLPHIHWHKSHSIVAEDIDHFHGHGVAAGLGVGVRRGDEFQVAVFASAETLPFVFEDVAAGPAVFKFRFFNDSRRSG